jgi:hypothetical protein
MCSIFANLNIRHKKGLQGAQAKRVNHAAAKQHEDSCKCYISEIYLNLVQFIP